MSEQPKECQTYTLSACTGHQAAQGAIAEMFAEFRAVGEALGAGDEETRWLPLEKWDACAGAVDAPSLKGQRCWAGLDLASTEDITALVLAFPDEGGGYDVLPFFWIPEDTIEKRSRRDRVPYDVWARQGLVYTTPGNACDYAFIRARLNELAEQFDIVDIGLDPWNARQLGGELMEDGFEIVDFRQGYASMSAPTKELLRLVGERDQALKQAEHYCGEMVRRNDEIEIVLNQRDEALKRAEAAEGELWYSQHTVADLRNQLLTAKRGLQ